MESMDKSQRPMPVNAKCDKHKILKLNRRYTQWPLGGANISAIHRLPPAYKSNMRQIPAEVNASTNPRTRNS